MIAAASFPGIQVTTKKKKSFATLAPAGEDLPRHGGQGPGGGRGLGAEPAPVEAQPGPG